MRHETQLSKEQIKELNKVRKLVEFWGISQASLAAKMHMLPGTFSNKMRTNHRTKFTAEEIERLKYVLIELANEIIIQLTEWRGFPIPFPTK